MLISNLENQEAIIMGYKRLTRKQWKRKYYYLCEKATKLFKEYNPCKFNKNGYCNVKRKNKSVCGSCCLECKHLSKTGCTVKNLSCKIFLCSEMCRKYPELGRKLNKIHDIAHHELRLYPHFFDSISGVMQDSWNYYKFKGE